MRLATIDVGTNTVLLLIADIENGKLNSVFQAERIGRLGEGVDATKRIRVEAMQRVCNALNEYKAICAEYNVLSEHIYVGGTSASRDAANQAELIAFVKAKTDLDYHLISGEAEAEMSFRGVLAVMPHLQGECVVLDIGGGSSEVIWGNADSGEVLYRHSFNMGSIRIKERFFSQVPPLQHEQEAAQQFVQRLFDEVPFPKSLKLPLVVVAGVGTKLGLLEANANDWEELLPSQTRISATRVKAWFERVMAQTPDETLAMNPHILHGRQDVFCASLMILNTCIQTFGFETCSLSQGGWRHGWALNIAKLLTATF